MNYALIGGMILVFSTFGGWLLVRLKHTDKSKQVKWALFVLYFWLLNFVQLIGLAVVYQLTQ
ncbi:MAG: hypothetical protein GQ581_03955 [Methyloprofundus sp.]|nr:hypothetical protein [Methyloprofundus sp.]